MRTGSDEDCAFEDRVASGCHEGKLASGCDDGCDEGKLASGCDRGCSIFAGAAAACDSEKLTRFDCGLSAAGKSSFNDGGAIVVEGGTNLDLVGAAANTSLGSEAAIAGVSNSVLSVFTASTRNGDRFTGNTDDTDCSNPCEDDEEN